MPLVIGVRFNQASKVYFFDPVGFENLQIGEHVVVETARGEEIGRVVIPPQEVALQEIVGRLKEVLRRASALDLSQAAYYRYREQEALTRCREKVQEHNLPMKVVRAEYNYDGSHLVFFFTSEKRVDFRRLVQDLARAFRARIELRQIGVRDEAKLIGGLGKCGLPLCCAAWLTEFSPVSIKMAKHQDLPLSPMEISGTCGRLLCCLAYEDEQYLALKGQLPRVGDLLDTPKGRGKVTEVNVIKESFRIELENQAIVEVAHEELLAPEPAPSKPKEHQQPRRRRRGKS